ncbi:hypothetical protein [Amycolatopsis solani]|uniref:hypothetical protein n=1 Tax=Amycolatopsis solani TaxID=3028615 RepID=UPI0025AFB04A|nr:hypothetical protein [Amycolatopsis sp. MEP2-6]
MDHDAVFPRGRVLTGEPLPSDDPEPGHSGQGGGEPLALTHRDEVVFGALLQHDQTRRRATADPRGDGRRVEARGARLRRLGKAAQTVVARRLDDRLQRQAFSSFPNAVDKRFS